MFVLLGLRARAAGFALTGSLPFPVYGADVNVSNAALKILYGCHLMLSIY